MLALGFLFASILFLAMAALFLEKERVITSMLYFAGAGYLLAEFAFQIRS